MLILGLKVENIQDDPGTFIVPESKEVKETQEPIKELPITKAGTI